MTRAFRDLPLFWKLLLPSLVLIILTGVVGGVLLVRDLSAQARASVNQSLFQASLNARALLQERELFLLESATLAANLEGMDDAVARGDAAATAELLRSILALKPDLGLLVAADAEGRGLAEFTRADPESDLDRGRGGRWARTTFVRRALADERGDRRGGLLQVEGRPAFAVAAPICSETDRCGTVGVAIVGAWLDDLVGIAAPAQQEGVSVALYDLEGALLAASVGTVPETAGVLPEGEGLVRRTEDAPGGEVASLHGPLQIQGRTVGVTAVRIPLDPTLGSVGSAGGRLALLLIAALAGIVAIGALLSRVILGQVRPLVETNRRLSAGDLSARAPVLGRDELGELATGVNVMAEALQASHETLEGQVALRTEEVRRLLAERTEFFASVSHEFRTPLAIIMSQAEMLLEQVSSTKPKDREALETIKRSSDQVLGLINDILEITKAEAGRLRVDPQPFELSEAIDEMSGTLRGLTRGSELDLDVAIPPDLPMLSADPRRLREVMLNLVDNAVKYTPPGGSVRIDAKASDGSVELRVSDTGVGIPDEVGERIFEPFYALGKTQRGEVSSGLGLALTKRLVEAQGGTLRFSNNEDVGTTFIVTFPVADKARRSWKGPRARPQDAERR